MSSSDSAPPSVDYTSIRFPSDGLTVADIRRAHPGRFDVEVPEAFHHMDEEPDMTLTEMIATERLLARAAFEKARGNPVDILEDEVGLERRDLIEGMTEDYLKYGITKGLQHTEQMIRGIESQADAQAKRSR